MTGAKPKRNYKDSLFRQYFETPNYLAGFHKRLTGIPTSAEDIKINTIKTIMFNSQRNDISFLANDRFMVLSEHQSSINENMPLRMLLYVAMLYYRQVRRKTLYLRRFLYSIQWNEHDYGVTRWNDGRIDGRNEMAIDTAIKMLRFNEPIEKIVTYTNLSTQKIEELAQQIH